MKYQVLGFYLLEGFLFWFNLLIHISFNDLFLISCMFLVIHPFITCYLICLHNIVHTSLLWMSAFLFYHCNASNFIYNFIWLFSVFVIYLKVYQFYLSIKTALILVNKSFLLNFHSRIHLFLLKCLLSLFGAYLVSSSFACSLKGKVSLLEIFLFPYCRFSSL